MSTVVTAYQMSPAYRTLIRPPSDQFVSTPSPLRASEFGNIRTFLALRVASVFKWLSPNCNVNRVLSTEFLPDFHPQLFLENYLLRWIFSEIHRTCTGFLVSVCFCCPILIKISLLHQIPIQHFLLLLFEQRSCHWLSVWREKMHPVELMYRFIIFV